MSILLPESCGGEKIFFAGIFHVPPVSRSYIFSIRTILVFIDLDVRKFSQAKTFFRCSFLGLFEFVTVCGSDLVCHAMKKKTLQASDTQLNK